MKVRTLNLLFVATAGFLIIISGSSFMGFYPGGSPGGYSGSPLDGKNCVNCHGGSATTKAGIISSDIDTSGYIAGTVYNITVSVPGSGLKGFEVSPLNASNQKAGVLAAGTNTKIVNSSKGITQSVTTIADPGIWSFKWTAPSKGTGTVIFYGAFVATKPNIHLSTMVVKEKSTTSVLPVPDPEVRLFYDQQSKILIFESDEPVAQQICISIFSLSGKELFQDTKKCNSGKSVFKRNISAIHTPGIYIIKYSAGQKNITKKIYLY